MRRVLILIIATAFLAACTINGSKPIAGWPRLEVVEHYVSPEALLDQCQKYAFFGGVAEACAEFDLEKGLCNIYYNKDFPPSQMVIAHEREHCAGYDHIGGTELSDLLQRSKEAQ